MCKCETTKSSGLGPDCGFFRPSRRAGRGRTAVLEGLRAGTRAPRCCDGPFLAGSRGPERVAESRKNRGIRGFSPVFALRCTHGWPAATVSLWRSSVGPRERGLFGEAPALAGSNVLRRRGGARRRPRRMGRRQAELRGRTHTCEDSSSGCRPGRYTRWHTSEPAGVPGGAEGGRYAVAERVRSAAGIRGYQNRSHER